MRRRVGVLFDRRWGRAMAGIRRCRADRDRRRRRSAGFDGAAAAARRRLRMREQDDAACPWSRFRTPVRAAAAGRGVPQSRWPRAAAAASGCTCSWTYDGRGAPRFVWCGRREGGAQDLEDFLEDRRFPESGEGAGARAREGERERGETSESSREAAHQRFSAHRSVGQHDKRHRAQRFKTGQSRAERAGERFKLVEILARRATCEAGKL